MKKFYQVFYIIKKSRKEHINHLFVLANNAKEACSVCKSIVLNRTGCNAFRPTTTIDKLIK